MPKISLMRWVKKNPAMFFGSLLIVFLSFGLLFYKLNTLHPSPNMYEIKTLEKINNFSDVINNPLDIVYLSVAKGLSFVFSDLTALRLTSVLFAIFTLLNLRFIIKYWYDTRTANIGALLAVSSFWFLTIARNGAPLIMPAFWLSSIMALYAWSKYFKKPALIKTLIIFTACIALYSPNFLWWILAVGILLFFRYGFKSGISQLKSPLAAIPVILVAPLIYACFDADVLKQLLGLNGLSLNPIEYIKNVISYFSQIAFKSNFNPAINLGRLPLIDIFQLFMLVIGFAALYTQRRNLRGKLTLFAPLIFIGLISLFSVDQAKIALLMPLVFIIITAGINEFINLWLKGFPRNPIGRATGLLLVSCLIGASGFYNMQRYFVAWAQNPDVKAAHEIKQ